MKISSLEDIKEMKAYIVEAERWHIFNSENTYIVLIVQGIDFSMIDADDFEDYSDEILGLDNGEFLKWLLNKSEEEGYDYLPEYLESEFFIMLDNYDVEAMYNEETNKLISKEEKSNLFNTEGFQLTNSQPSFPQEYFLTVDEANDFLKKIFPFHN